MKKTILLTVALLGGSLFAAGANAAGHFHGGGFHHGGFHGHGHGRVGVFVGVGPLFPPYYYPPAYYYPPYYPPAVAVAPVAAPPVYIEQQPAAIDAPAPAVPGGPGSGAYWYFCRDTQTYYPYVKQCASPWERVAPNNAPPA